MGWGGGPCDFSVSPRSKSFFFLIFGGVLFDLGACWDKGLDSDLDQGLTIMAFLCALDRKLPELLKMHPTFITLALLRTPTSIQLKMLLFSGHLVVALEELPET